MRLLHRAGHARPPEAAAHELSRREHHHGGEADFESTFGNGVGEGDAPADADRPERTDEQALADTDVAVTMLALGAESTHPGDRQQRRRLRLQVPEPEPESQCGDEEHASPDAEQSRDDARGHPEHEGEDDLAHSTTAIATTTSSAAKISDSRSWGTRCCSAVPPTTPARAGTPTNSPSSTSTLP